MAERVRALAKRSGSKLGLSKGSVTHIGSTPYVYKVDIFISYVDGLRTADDVCVTWEKHGNIQSTPCVKVKDQKAVFQKMLSMETTFFRRSKDGAKACGPPVKGEEMKFDEKAIKISIRKGGPEGKSVGKIHLNMADYVRGPSGTIFADLKLNNGSTMVTKIETQFLHIGKKSRKSSNGDSDAITETTEVENGMDDDSIFGDNAPERGDIDVILDDVAKSAVHASAPAIQAGVSSPNSPAVGTRSASHSPGISSSSIAMSPLRASTSTVLAREQRNSESGRNASNIYSSKQVGSPDSAMLSASTMQGFDAMTDGGKKALDDTDGSNTCEQHRQSDALKESPSIRNKIKAKLHRDKGSKKDSFSEGGKTAQKAEEAAKAAFANAEIDRLRSVNERLENENNYMKKLKQDMLAEINALRTELQTSETAMNALSREKDGHRKITSGDDQKLRHANKDLEDKILVLEAQVEGLMDELEERQQAVGDASGSETRRFTRVRSYEKRIEELEIALRREPKFLDVVDELKVTKMALALANMEKEQAVFALRKIEAAAGSPVSVNCDNDSETKTINTQSPQTMGWSYLWGGGVPG